LSARVYECSKSEVEELKKTLSYDPYLDTSLIPPSQKGSDKPVDKMSPEELKEMENRTKSINEAMEKLGQKAKIIFSRQEYELKDGAAVGLKSDTTYLYLNAPDEFLKGAEERFKTEFKTIKRASPEEEQKVISSIKEEQERANAGFGSIFGN
jgi:hypothetical protein